MANSKPKQNNNANKAKAKSKSPEVQFDVFTIGLVVLQLLLVFVLTYPLGGGNALFTVYINDMIVPVTSKIGLEQELNARLPQNVEILFLDAGGGVTQTINAGLPEIGGSYIDPAMDTQLNQYLTMDVTQVIQHKMDSDMNSLLGSLWGSTANNTRFDFSYASLKVNEQASIDYAKKCLSEHAASAAGIENPGLYANDEHAKLLAEKIAESLRGGKNAPVQVDANGIASLAA